VREIETAEVDAKKGELDELIRAQSMSADIFDQQFSGEVTRLADENSALREDVDAKQAAITRCALWMCHAHTAADRCFVCV
jgi:membrane protein required for beta-lactamase induction